MSPGDLLREVADGIAHLLGLFEPFTPYATAAAAFVAAMIALISLSHRRQNEILISEVVDKLSPEPSVPDPSTIKRGPFSRLKDRTIRSRSR